jgi:hypothetical protein
MNVVGLRVRVARLFPLPAPGTASPWLLVVAAVISGAA